MRGMLVASNDCSHHRMRVDIPPPPLMPLLMTPPMASLMTSLTREPSRSEAITSNTAQHLRMHPAVQHKGTRRGRWFSTCELRLPLPIPIPM